MGRAITGAAIVVAATWACAVPALGAGAVPATACDQSRPAVAYGPGDRTAAVPDAGRLVPCRYDTGGRALEPSLDVTADGRVLFQEWQLRPGAPDGAPLRPSVYRSDASLSNWQDVSPPVGPVTSLDPFLTIDHRTGRVFSVNFLADGQTNCATISHSDDDGTSWVSSLAACTGFDGESIGVGPPVSSKPIGYPDLVYYCTGTTPASSQPTTSPICSKSLDGGLTFVPTGTPPWPVVDQSAENDHFGPWAGNPIVGPDGAVYIPKRFAGQPEVAISRNEGLTWTHLQVAHNGSAGETPRMAVDARGDLFYAWAGDDHLPYLAYSRDGGRTWSAPIPLAPPGLREGVLPRPAVGSDGHVFVAYVGSADSPARPPFAEYCNVLLSPCDDANYAHVTWNGYMTDVSDVFAPHPRLQTATVNAPARPLLIGACSADGGCKAELDFIDAKVGPDGTDYAAFVDDCQLQRDYIPVFGQNMGRCGDNEGEGIVGRLVPAAAGVAGGGPAKAGTPGAVCASRRSEVVHVPRRLLGAARWFDVVVAGRVRFRRHDPRRGALVALRGRPRGAVPVVLVIHLRDGSVVRDRRTYHPCRPGPPGR